MIIVRIFLCLTLALTGCDRDLPVATPAAQDRTVPPGSDATSDDRVDAFRAKVVSSGRDRTSPQMKEFLNDPAPVDWVRPLSEVLPRLLTRAKAGEVEAAFVLGERLSHCHAVLLGRSPEVVLDEYEQELVWAGLDPERDADDTRLHNLENRTLAALDHHADCVAAGPEVAGAAQWLETAARAGHARARINYASGGLAEYASRGALIRDVEEVARRQALARGWLEAGLRAGDEMALNRYVAAVRKGDLLYPHDPHKAQVYGYVQQLLGARRVGDFDALWRDGPTRAPNFDEAAWQAALTQGRELFDSTFRDAPLYPR